MPRDGAIKCDALDTNTFLTSCPTGTSFRAGSSCEGRVSLHRTQSGFWARGKRRGFSPGAVARHSQYARFHTELVQKHTSFSFCRVHPGNSTREGWTRQKSWADGWIQNQKCKKLGQNSEEENILGSGGWTQFFQEFGFSRLNLVQPAEPKVWKISVQPAEPKFWTKLPTPAGVVVEKGSEYILAHTGPRELDGHPLGGCGLGLGLVPVYTTLLVRLRANIISVP